MGKIDLGQLCASAQALKQLSSRTAQLGIHLETLLEDSRRIADGSGSEAFPEDSVDRRVREAAMILAQEAAAMRRFSESLQKTAALFRQAERRIIDIYQGEVRIFPRTQFGTSRFENLHSFEHCMPIRSGGSQGTDAFRTKGEDPAVSGKERKLEGILL